MVRERFYLGFRRQQHNSEREADEENDASSGSDVPWKLERHWCQLKTGALTTRRSSRRAAVDGTVVGGEYVSVPPSVGWWRPQIRRKKCTVAV